MKRPVFFDWALPVCLAWTCIHPMLAQTPVSMPYNNGPATFTLAPPAQCSYLFSDDGGANNPYATQSGAGSVVTFFPSAPGNKIVVQFSSFQTETGFDALFVYDGPNTTSPQISSFASALSGLPNPFSAGAGGWQGSTAPYNVAPNTIRATASNATGAITFAFDTDLTIGKGGWTATVSEVPGSVCSIQAPGTVTVTAPAGACTATVQTVPPAISPGACAVALELRYRLNDGPAITVPTPAPPMISLSDVPVGLNVVTWQLVAPCGDGLAASASQLITVNDATPPTILVPANVTLNLGPGQCTLPHHYAVSALDNCAFATAGRVDHPVDFDNGAAGIMFDIKNLGAETLVITEFGPVLDPGTWPLEVYVTTSASGWQAVANSPSAWTQAGTRSAVSTGADAGTPLTDFHIILPPGESRGVYLTSSVGAPLRCTGTGSGVQRQYDDGALQVASKPGASVGFPFGLANVSRGYNGYVRYAAPHTKPEQIAGLPPDADFPAGTTHNVFRCTDESGNTSTASFSVTVVPYGNVANSLICAGMVNASLGPDCETTLQADDILFGGPYRCLDAYIVQLDKIPPYNNGPWVPAHLTSADIGKTYGVRVTDPVNDNFCMGNVLVEDKLPPVLTGDTIDLPCNFNPEPTFVAPASIVRQFVPAKTLPAGVSDYQTMQLDIPADAPQDAVVEDVDVHLRINGDVFEKNLRVELENPAGSTVVLWNQATGCTGPLWVRFDDEAPAGADCSQYNSNLRARIPFNSATLKTFDGGPVAGTWKLRIRDLNGFGDLATATEVQLIVRYKADFTAGFPNGLLLSGQLKQVAPNSFVASAPLLDGCSDVTLSYSDETTTQPCSTGVTAIIDRKWTAKDASNNVTTLVQTIRLLRPGLEDVVLPPNYNEADQPAFECGSAYPTPAWIESQGKSGTPHVFGQSAGCSVSWSYTDGVVDVCPGSYTINRNWLIFDACTGQSMQATQLVRVIDKQGPQLSCPANLTVSTDLYNCCATVNLPDVVVEDACSNIANPRASIVVFDQYYGDTLQKTSLNGTLTTFPGNNLNDPDTLAAFGNTTCLPVGVHHVYYKVEDACGNAKTCSFKLTIRDYSPPVAVGHNLTIVSLNADDANDCYEADPAKGLFGGVSTVPASTFDQGSYDNCNFIKLTVRRQPPYSPCIQALNAENGGPPCHDAFPDLKSEYAKAVAESDSIRFYCCEAGSTQTLILRCYQLDALGNLAVGANGNPLFNETQIQVEVQDKLKPGCQSPADLTLSCENFDPTLGSYPLPGLQDNCCLDMTKSYLGQGGLTQTLDYTHFDTLCNRGTILRTFTVYDCQGQTSQCSQQINVFRNVDYAIKFPDDVIVSSCDSSGYYGKPVFFGKDCESLAVSFQDELFTAITDGCYQIERTWRIIDFCDHLPGAGCIAVPNPTPNAVFNDPSNLPGPIVSPPGTPAPWAATVVKAKPTDPQATDYSKFWDGAVNCYEYKQIIKVQDKEAPKLLTCTGAQQDLCDSTKNDTLLWNQASWNDPVLQSHNLAEAPVDLFVQGTDACAGSGVSLRYLLFLDTDGNGSQETVVNSADLPSANQLNVGNALNPNYTGGQPTAFDQRAISADQKYRFALQTSTDGAKRTAAVRWNTGAKPDVYSLPELPYGTHKIRWIAQDDCGNSTQCEYVFQVKDCAPPTVVGKSGLSVNLSFTCQVTLFVSDLLQSGADNFTPVNQIKYAVRKKGSGSGFPLKPDGSPQTAITFDATELGNQTVELWAMDLAGNAGFSETTIVVQDFGDCTMGSGSIAGKLATEAKSPLEMAKVQLDGTSPALPPVSLYTLTQSDGKYEFNGIPYLGDYTVTPFKDTDPLNGVSTFDLVLINKHILGLEPLNSPYKMIAADANESRSLTTFDIVELRKLILGIYTELPNATSWRFVDGQYVFPNPANPFQEVFPEVKQFSNLISNLFDEDFMAIKVGDVNGNAQANSATTSDDRSSGTLLFDVAPIPDGRLRPGQVFTLHFRAAEPVRGYQFTLYSPGLDVLDVTPGPDMTMGNFGIFSQEHALTTSFDNEQTAGEFDITFRANAAGELSQMLKVSSRITKAEAYALNVVNGLNVVNVVNETNVVNVRMGVALRFQGQNGPVVSGQGFELFQNQPNPWAGRTSIGFYLPEAAPVTLTVFDETGRTLFAHTGDYGRGYNTFQLNRSVLNTAGLLYYKVETPTDSAVRKMMQLR